MNTRTDIHRPGSLDFDPESYQLIGVFDLHEDPMEGGQRREFMQAVNEQVTQGNTFHGAPHGSGQCSHCGTYIRYAALMVHADTSTILCVGETCLDNRFDLTKAEFQSLRKAAKLNRERRQVQAVFEALCDEYPALAYATYAHNIGSAGRELELDPELQDPREEPFWSIVPCTEWSARTRTGWEITTLTDICDKVRRYGSVSDKQVAFVEKLLAKLETAEDRVAQREAERAVAAPAPTGKVTFEGTVLKEEWRDNPYSPGGYGGSVKITVKTDAGWIAWGTLPSALVTAEDGKGRRIRVAATVEPSDTDPKFAFFKRPTRQTAWLD